MAVICRTVDQYLLQIRYEFRLQNIPLFCDEPTTPENTAPARAIHAALDLLRGGLTTTALLRLLKTGLVDLDRDSQCALENYAYTWPLHAQDWREPFTRNPEGYTDRMSEQSQQDLQRAEEARSFLVPRVQKFMDRARNADTATLTAQIYYFLQSLGAEEALQKLTDGLRACGDLPNADEALREWNVITELLDQMVHLLPAGEPITPADHPAAAHHGYGAYSAKHGQRDLYHRWPHAPTRNRGCVCDGAGGRGVSPDTGGYRPFEPR